MAVIFSSKTFQNKKRKIKFYTEKLSKTYKI